MLKTSLVAATLLAVCYAQQSTSGSTSDKQLRLEDIERDTLTNAQQRQQTSQQSQQQSQTQQQQPAQQYGGLTSQQLAAYQQQLLLQQLQQQYFAPQPITYPSYNAVPLMIIPGNHLGVGSPALPLQAYFLPDPIIYQQPAAPAAPQQSAVAATVASQANSVYQVPTQRLQPAARYQPLVSNQLPVYRIPQAQQPVHNFLYTSTPPQASAQQQILLQQQSLHQPYNAYNAIYQQRQQKNLYSSGIKSTPAPPSLLKSSNQNNPVAYSQSLQNNDQTSSSYINYKSF